MAEYIDIDDKVVVTDTRGRERETTVRHIFEMNKGVYTAADVVERKHGEWEQKEDPYGFFDTIPVCSVCGCTTKYRVTSAYCPNCGADMRGEDDV